MATIQQLANELSLSFEKRTRDNGDAFLCLKDDAPAWMRDVVRKAHWDMLPDDYTFQAVAALAAEISDTDEHTDLFEVAAGMSYRVVSVYNGELISWLGSHSSRWSRVDEALREWGYNEEIGLFGVLQTAQHEELLEICWALLYALADRRDELEEEEEE